MKRLEKSRIGGPRAAERTGPAVQAADGQGCRLASGPAPKRSRKGAAAEEADEEEDDTQSSLPAQFVTVEGRVGPRVDLPLAATQDQMERLVNQLGALQKADEGENEAVPYAFYVNEREVTGSLKDLVQSRSFDGVGAHDHMPAAGGLLGSAGHSVRRDDAGHTGRVARIVLARRSEACERWW